uniref:Uncharacterized protein n=1 Tax=Arundo donax TaxID=35708 RepID=A0A0A9BMW2_ARUDO
MMNVISLLKYKFAIEVHVWMNFLTRTY